MVDHGYTDDPTTYTTLETWGEALERRVNAQAEELSRYRAEAVYASELERRVDVLYDIVRAQNEVMIELNRVLGIVASAMPVKHE